MNKGVITIGKSQRAFYAAQHTGPAQKKVILLHSSTKLYIQQSEIAAIPAEE